MVAAAPSDDDLKVAINKVPEAYSEFIPIMTAEMAVVLPEHSAYDHAIDPKDGTTPPWGPTFPAFDPYPAPQVVASQTELGSLATHPEAIQVKFRLCV